MDKLLTNTNGKLLGNEDGKVYTTPAITDRTYKQKYQEVLWLGSDEIPLLPTQMPEKSSNLITFLRSLNTIWTDINPSLINTYGYDRVVFLAKYDGKIVKVEIVKESSGNYATRVHSSVYKENVKECISINTYKRYMLVNDTYTSPSSGYDYQILRNIGKKNVNINDVYYSEEYGGYSLHGKILKPDTNYLVYLMYSRVVLLLHTYGIDEDVIEGQTSLYRDTDSDQFCWVSVDTQSFDDVDLLYISSITDEIKNEEIAIYEMPF